jgi:hypothetical protein
LGFVLNKLEKKTSSTFDVEPKPMIWYPWAIRSVLRATW